MKKTNLTVLFYLVLVFVSGILVGAFGQRLYSARSVNANPNPRPDEWRQHYLEEMRRRLHVDDNQVAQVNSILDKTRERFDAVRKRMQPEMDAIHQDQIDQITALLNATQRAEYAKMLEERRLERQRREKK